VQSPYPCTKPNPFAHLSKFVCCSAQQEGTPINNSVIVRIEFVVLKHFYKIIAQPMFSAAWQVGKHI
jgi:hypothetical protein